MTIYFVTGVSSGIGSSLVDSLLDDENNFVIGISRSSHEKSSLSSIKNKRFIYFSADVTDADQMIAIKEQLIDKNMIPDFFLLNAGISPDEGEENLSSDIFRSIYEVNFFSNIQLVSMWMSEIIACKKQSWFYVTSTVSAKIAFPFYFGYGSSKAAINYCFDSLDLRYRSKGVRFGYYMPGPVETPLLDGHKLKHMIPVDVATKIIIKQINRKKRILVFPLYWRIFAFVYKYIPYSIKVKMFGVG